MSEALQGVYSNLTIKVVTEVRSVVSIIDLEIELDGDEGERAAATAIMRAVTETLLRQYHETLTQEMFNAIARQNTQLDNTELFEAVTAGTYAVAREFLKLFRGLSCSDVIFLYMDGCQDYRSMFTQLSQYRSQSVGQPIPRPQPFQRPRLSEFP